jgi:hypothetical protein
MPREPALSAARRWEVVRKKLREESRAATFDKKLAQLASLMSAVESYACAPVLVGLRHFLQPIRLTVSAL